MLTAGAAVDGSAHLRAFRGVEGYSNPGFDTLGALVEIASGQLMNLSIEDR